MHSAAFEAFGATRTLSALIQHVKSKEAGYLMSEQLDSLIGGVLANQRSVGGVEYCVRIGFLRSPFRHFMFSCTGMTLAVIMSVQEKLICVRLVMPRCMFNMQLILSEIVKFSFDRK